VSAAVAAIMSPLASTIVLAIAASAFVLTVESTALPNIAKSAGKSFTRSVGSGIIQL